MTLRLKSVLLKQIIFISGYTRTYRLRRSTTRNYPLIFYSKIFNKTVYHLFSILYSFYYKFYSFLNRRFIGSFFYFRFWWSYF